MSVFHFASLQVRLHAAVLRLSLSIKLFQRTAPVKNVSLVRWLRRAVRWYHRAVQWLRWEVVAAAAAAVVAVA